MSFKQELINWYRINKRDLPWRNTKDPYLIWLSEIILQQTRVEQGMPYFLKFSDKFPNVQMFANASEDEVLRLWQGLGYYSRGRNMLKTAKKVMADFNGNFPVDYNDLISLVGVGEYTAAAISSFSANEARAVVDGNVYRFLSRYFGIDTPINSTSGKKEFQKIADEVLDFENAGEHNQAMIEFGALVCKPKNPHCSICPFMDSCFAFKKKLIDKLPVKLKKLKIKERFFYYFILIKGDKILIKRRHNNDIWAGLHDLPSIEFSEETSIESLLSDAEFINFFGNNPVIKSISNSVKHVLTHQKIYARFVHLDSFKEEMLNQNDWFWVEMEKLDDYGQPKLIFEFLQNFVKFI